MKSMFNSFPCKDTVAAAKITLEAFMNNELAGLEVDFWNEIGHKHLEIYRN